MSKWEFRGPQKSASQIATSLKLTRSLWSYDDTSFEEESQAKVPKEKPQKK